MHLSCIGQNLHFKIYIWYIHAYIHINIYTKSPEAYYIDTNPNQYQNLKPKLDLCYLYFGKSPHLQLLLVLYTIHIAYPIIWSHPALKPFSLLSFYGYTNFNLKTDYEQNLFRSGEILVYYVLKRNWTLNLRQREYFISEKMIQ